MDNIKHTKYQAQNIDIFIYGVRLAIFLDSAFADWPRSIIQSYARRTMQLCLLNYHRREYTAPTPAHNPLFINDTSQETSIPGDNQYKSQFAPPVQLTASLRIFISPVHNTKEAMSCSCFKKHISAVYSVFLARNTNKKPVIHYRRSFKFIFSELEHLKSELEIPDF